MVRNGREELTGGVQSSNALTTNVPHSSPSPSESMSKMVTRAIFCGWINPAVTAPSSKVRIGA